jgi:hypothetical protein
MKENPLLLLLAKLCGDITFANNPDYNKLVQLQQSLASALISDPALNVSAPFQFEQVESFTTQHLSAEDLDHLSGVLQRVEESGQATDNNIRVFRREVPFVSSQVRGSVPGWARGASIVGSVGPFINREGRRSWFDLYRVIPAVQVWMQGAAQPFLIVPLEVRNFLNFFRPNSFKIPKGSVWINADLFTPPSPDNLYCGLTVEDSELSFTHPLTVTADNKILVPPGVEASVKLNLRQKVVTDASPDNNGIDASEATIALPKTLSFTINHSGKSITADNSSWALYGQSINFTYDNVKPMRWSPELNRVLIPYTADVAEFDVVKCKSPVCTINGKAAIAESWWALSAAAININAPLEADGTGAMATGVVQGLEVSWLGLKDANLFEKGSASLKNALVMLMPGRVSIATMFAYNPTGMQRYNLWQVTSGDVQEPVQYIDLLYTKQFFFFYDSLQSGTESVVTQANCINSVDKPVAANGSPFKVESLQTTFALSISQASQIVMLFDDDIIKDNWNKTQHAAGTPVTFESTALALNNALLTVSPVYGMLLYGDLKTEDTFDKCLLVYSFGLLQYLPTLPDPYAANVALLRRRRFRRGAVDNANDLQNQHYLAEINSLLVCLMSWNNMDAPAINFFIGDKPANAQNVAVDANVANPYLTQGTRINALHDREVLQQYQRSQVQATVNLQNRTWQAVTDNQDTSAQIVNNDYNAMARVNEGISRGSISPFQNAFALVDVSTNADLMGVSLGFANDDFIFRQTHTAQDELPANPISINGLDVQATSRLVQMYALPQISWEPVINISEITNPAKDPWPGILFFLNDGIPAQIANTGNEPVNLAPIPLSKKLTEWYDSKPNFMAWSYFTLPYGMLAVAMYYKQPDGNNPAFELIEKKFKGDLHTGLQLKTVGLDDTKKNNKKFFGSAHQLDNVYNLFFPATGARSILSGTVTYIFNREFGEEFGFNLNKYVPLERYDFNGYGANVFSHWINEKAAIARTSQAMFDVWRGRTAHEVIQVKSVLYPWAIRVVRTITIYRASTGFEWRIDSGWKAESDGIYDFRPIVDDEVATTMPAAVNEENAHAYRFHPGMVEGVFNVRNIKEDITLAPFTKPWNKNYGFYINDQGDPTPVGGGQALDINLVPVYFDADVQLDDVTQGASKGKVLSQRMLGYLQLSPRGVFIDEESFAELLTKMSGLGGPVDCMVNINQSKQQMRITRVEVNPSRNAANERVFVTAAKGTPILPKDGNWSVAQHDLASKEVTPLSNNDVIPLIREGLRVFLPDPIVPPPPPIDPNAKNYTQDKDSKPVNIAEASELFKALESRAKQYGFIQSTGENKILFRNPLFEKNIDTLKGSIPDLADAYRLMNSKGIFPKVENLPKIDKLAADFEMKIKEEGYKLLNKINPVEKLVQELPEGPWYIVKTNDVKVYIEYKKSSGEKSKLDLDIDSTANAWLNKMNDVAMVVDLSSFKRLVIIRGKFDTKKGQAPSFTEPIMEFGPDLKPVVDILVLLSQIAINPDYKDILKKGLKIAMSNSPNNWEYKFQADKEIPVIKFPPISLDGPTTPLRLEASLKAGVYFNVAIPLPPTTGIPAPSAGAFVEFNGKLSVMCVSLAAATVYAVGQATVRISADTVTGPALYMKFGFGVELMVGLPVIGNVSVMYAVGVEMSLDTQQITIGAFLLFRGRAELIGGLVTVTIQIEAAGKVQDRIGGETNMIAQVTFSLDISICFVIDINFTESWQEQRQIA